MIVTDKGHRGILYLRDVTKDLISWLLLYQGRSNDYSLQSPKSMIL